MLVAVLAFLGMQGCDNGFSPKGGFTPLLVVYGVLRNDVPYQIIRVEQTYDSEDLQPDQPQAQPIIPDARVWITSRSGTFGFTDTLLTLPGGETRKVWICRTLVPMENVQYTLHVSAPGLGDATATTIFPSRLYASITPVGGYGGPRDTMLVKPTYEMFASPPVAAYYRIHVAASSWVNGTPVEKRREVPIAHAPDSSWVYPAPSTLTRLYVPTSYIKETRERLRSLDSADSFLGILVVGHALDQGLYQYYKVVRGFQDPISMRTDIPDISNVSGGLGIFGSLASDSTRVLYKDLIR